jgi:uncharacterized membrane protein
MAAPRPWQQLIFAALAVALVVVAWHYRPQRLPENPVLFAQAEATCFAAGGGSFTVTRHAGAATGVECEP